MQDSIFRVIETLYALRFCATYSNISPYLLGVSMKFFLMTAFTLVIYSSSMGMQGNSARMLPMPAQLLPYCTQERTIERLKMEAQLKDRDTLRRIVGFISSVALFSGFATIPREYFLIRVGTFLMAFLCCMYTMTYDSEYGVPSWNKIAIMPIK